jgi:hypothetical protein
MKTNIYLEDIAKIILAIMFWPITIFYFLIKIISGNWENAYNEDIKQMKEGK